MKTQDIGVIALVAICAFAGAFFASYMVPAAAAFNQPYEDGTGPYHDYVNKVVPITTTTVTEGTLFFKVQCGHNVFTKEVVIQKLIQTNPGYAVPNGRVAQDEVIANFVPLGGERTFAINPDGSMDTQLPAGTYSAMVKDGNGGQPEFALFTIKPTQTLMVTMIGHAFSGAEQKEKVRIIIDEAKYGKIVKVIDQAAQPGTPGTPAQTHQDYEAGHVHAKKVGSHSPHDFYYNGDKYQIVGNQAEPAFHYCGYYGTHPAQVVTIVDVPAVPGTPAIPEVSHFEGQIIDVTAQVQAAVDAGATQFRFNNAMHPGGIVNVDQTEVIVGIMDPAVGIVKDVMIKYNGVTINTQEYQIITIS